MRIYTFCRIFFISIMLLLLTCYLLVISYLLNSKSFTFLSMSDENIKLFNSLFLE